MTRDSLAARVARELEQRRADWLPKVLPAGTIRGGKFFIGDADGNPGESIPIPLRANGKALRDFADGFSGDDLDLYAHAKHLSLAEAIPDAVAFLGLEHAGPTTRVWSNGRASTTGRARASENSRAKATGGPRPNGHTESRHKGPHPDATAVYSGYVMPDGEPWIEVHRFDLPGRRKFFRQRIVPTGEWVEPGGAELPEPRPLYRIPDLIGRPDERVVFVAGEKCAEALAELGFLATTNLGGENGTALAKADLAPLAGRNVLTWGDHDAAGERWAADLVRLLRKIGARPFLVPIPPDKPEKWDAANAIEDDGWNADQINALLAEAPEAEAVEEPEPERKAPNGCPPLQSMAAFISGYVAPDYLIDGLMQRERVYALTGPTGHGKTAVALAIAAHKATGRPLAGRRIDAGRVVYLAAENPDDARGRAILIADRMGLDPDKTPLFFAPGAFNLATGLAGLEAYVRDLGGAECIVVDTGAAFLAMTETSDENDNLAALRFALDLRRLTALPGKPTVLALMHPVKHASRDNLLPRGGGAFLNEMDGNFTVWADESRETTELHWAGKLRGPNFDPITFALETGTCPGLVDAAGRTVPSVWAYQTGPERSERSADRQRRDDEEVLVLMSEALGGSLSTWAQALGWMLSSGEPAKQRVQRAVNRLAAEHLAEVKLGRWRLTKAGRTEAERLKGGRK